MCSGLVEKIAAGTGGSLAPKIRRAVHAAHVRVDRRRPDRPLDTAARRRLPLQLFLCDRVSFCCFRQRTPATTLSHANAILERTDSVVSPLLSIGVERAKFLQRSSTDVVVHRNRASRRMEAKIDANSRRHLTRDFDYEWLHCVATLARREKERGRGTGVERAIRNDIIKNCDFWC